MKNQDFIITENSMYCTTCNCEYNGWSGKCPSCKQPLLDDKPAAQIQSKSNIEYRSLVELIEENGAALDIDLCADQVTRNKTTRFPWLGFGYAWTQSMLGEHQAITVELITTEVGKDRKWSFPYQGHGHAWQQEMQGWIAGNQCSVQATEVKRSRTWRFPYTGYGYAWTEQMHGECGDQIHLTMSASKVSKKRGWVFPYFGYGYAWVDKYWLALELV
jgi:hypothetical protein